MRNAQHQVGDSTALTKIGSFIASLFKGSREVECVQDETIVNPQNNEHRNASPVIYEQHDGLIVGCGEAKLESRDLVADRLIAKAPLTPEAFRPSPRFFTTWSQYKLIHTLYVRGEVSRRELGELVDISNIPDLVARANRLGWSICCQRKGELDASGRCRYRGYYSLSEDVLSLVRAKLYLSHRGYV